MSTHAPGAITLVCCSVLDAEMKLLCLKHWPDLPMRIQDSMLHMKPDRLADRLGAAVEEELRAGHGVVLVYGDCCGRMAALEARPGVVRTRGNNCCELLLGRNEYHRLSHQGTFLLFPEWTPRWREILDTELGLNRENATDLMRDLHRKLVYLDTGIIPVPENALRDCAEYCGLPCEVLPVSLEVLRAAVQEALGRIECPGSMA